MLGLAPGSIPGGREVFCFFALSLGLEKREKEASVSSNSIKQQEWR